MENVSLENLKNWMFGNMEKFRKFEKFGFKNFSKFLKFSNFVNVRKFEGLINKI